MNDQELKNKRVTVMGLGHFGGGIGVTRWLAQRGCRVTVTDVQTSEQLQDSLGEIEDLVATGNITLALGGHRDEDFTSTDLVVANPAIPQPWHNRYLGLANTAGVPVTTEIQLLAERLPGFAQVIGITGSAGKSTTAAMICHVLRAELGEGRVYLGGNIGGSLLGSLTQMRPGDVVVLELSSAMLYWLCHSPQQPIAEALGRHRFACSIGVVTNISNNHIDWHGTFEHYQESKLVLARAAVGGVVVADGATFALVLQQTPGAQLASCEGSPLLAAQIRGLLPLPGEHNVLNGVTAVAAGLAVLNNLRDARGERDIAVAGERLAGALTTFRGLPHRLEFVATKRGVRYFNDSKSTTPQSCLLALRAFEGDSPPAGVHLIAGGYDKKSDLRPVAQAVSGLRGLYTVGATGPAIYEAAHSIAPDRAFSCETLARAVEMATSRAQPGDVILLSPACASWGQFRNYEERGEVFCELVHLLA